MSAATEPDLRSLLERVKGATGPDRGLDGRIAWALGWRFDGLDDGPEDPDFDDWEGIAGSWHQPGDVSRADVSKTERNAGDDADRWAPPPCWTESLDAVVALCERMLGVERVPDLVARTFAALWWRMDRPMLSQAALALLAALLSALVAEQEARSLSGGV